MAEIDKVKQESAARHYLAFMKALNLPINEETRDTPMRVARMFANEFCSFNGSPPLVAKFKRKDYDQYVVVRDVTVHSLCEHHHLPFSGVMHVGYHPKEWLAGLSKIPRVIRYFAGRPQLQEHLVTQVAEYLMSELDPHGVMVVCQASHSCMRVRGVQDPCSETVTSRVIESRNQRLDKTEMLALMGLK
jgi:GTP cyclohydrolase IA